MSKKLFTLIFICIIAVLAGRFLIPFFTWLTGLQFRIIASIPLILVGVGILLWVWHFLRTKIADKGLCFLLLFILVAQPPIGVICIIYVISNLKRFGYPEDQQKTLKFKYQSFFLSSLCLVLGTGWCSYIIYGSPLDIVTKTSKYDENYFTWKDKKYDCFGLEYIEKEEFVIDPDIYKAKTEEQQRENKKENTNSNSPTYSYPTTPIYQDPYPVSGGYNGGYNPYESSTIENTPRQKTKVRNDCPYCENGERIQHEPGRAATFGIDGPRVYCSKCNQSWSAGTVHAHHRCEYCNGQGYTEYEY